MRTGKTRTQDQDTAFCNQKPGSDCEDCEVDLLSLVIRVSLNSEGQEASKSTEVVKISFKIHMKLMKTKFPLKYLLLGNRTVRFWAPTTAERNSSVFHSTSHWSHFCGGSVHRCLALTCMGLALQDAPRQKLARHSGI